ELERLYLDPNVAPIERANTIVTPFIDGKFYFPQIADAINATQTSSDRIYLVAWAIELDWDLQTGRSELRSDDPTALGNVLFAKAAAAVDVRLILGGAILWWAPTFPFEPNFVAAEDLRGRKVNGVSYLQDRILWDWSGANISGSHHQKA